MKHQTTIFQTLLMVCLSACSVETTHSQDHLSEMGEQQFDQIPWTVESVDSLQQIAETKGSSDPQEAIYAALEALEISTSINYEEGEAHANKSIGRMYFLIGDYELSLDYLLRALPQFEDLENMNEVGGVMNAIANIHVVQENYEQAIRYYTETAKIMEDIGDWETVATLTMNLGVAYYYMGNYEESLAQYREAKEILESKVDHPRFYTIIMTNIGNVLIDLEEYEEAERHLLEAIAFFEEENHSVNLSGSYLYLAKLYHRTGNFEEALRYANNGRRIAEEISQSQYILESYERLADIYEDMSDFENALTNFKAYQQEQQRIFNEERSEQINRMQIQYEVDQKNQQIDLLNKEIALQEAQVSRQILWRNFLIIGLFLFAAILGMQYRNMALRKKANKLLSKRKEEIEKQNRQLVKLNEEKNEFLHIVAHDLRNPLTSLSGVAELIEIEGNDEKSRHENIGIIKESTNRMLKMIHDLLDVDAIEKNLESIDAKTLDITRTVDHLVEENTRHAGMKNISIRKVCDDKPVLIYADEGHLRSIIDNLLSNAIKFSDPGSDVQVLVEKKGDIAKISVKDAGPGITEEDQKQLFGRFNRLSNKPTGDEPSTGLGLYIVKKLTESMNGRVSFESVPGKGSIFTVTFPLAKAE